MKRLLASVAAIVLNWMRPSRPSHPANGGPDYSTSGDGASDNHRNTDTNSGHGDT